MRVGSVVSRCWLSICNTGPVGMGSVTPPLAPTCTHKLIHTTPSTNFAVNALHYIHAQHPVSVFLQTLFTLHNQIILLSNFYCRYEAWAEEYRVSLGTLGSQLLAEFVSAASRNVGNVLQRSVEGA
jgi:hypothetical protein